MFKMCLSEGDVCIVLLLLIFPFLHLILMTRLIL